MENCGMEDGRVVVDLFNAEIECLIIQRRDAEAQKSF